MAKKQKPTPTPPKKKGLASNRKRRKARKVTTVTTSSRTVRTMRSNPRANPPLVDDLTTVLLPGFAAYAATRTLARMVFAIVQKRWPKLGKHAHAASGLLAFGGVWFLGHRVQKLAKYHDGIVMGSGVAALHGVAQAYLPEKYRWLLADPKASDVRPMRLPMPAASAPALEEPTGGDEFSYLEAQLSELERTGKRKGTIAAPRPAQSPMQNTLDAAAAAVGDQGVTDLDLSEALDGEDLDDLYGGSFAPN